MAFTIPNVGVAGFTDQAEPDSVDIDILTAGHAGTGVVSGCVVTPQGSPDMTVAVASGSIRYAGGAAVAVSSGNVTVSAAHSTLARKDIIVVNSSGTKSITTGTAASQPLKPAIPASSLVLAEIYVPAADTAINSNQITDKRVIIEAAVTPGSEGATSVFLSVTDGFQSGAAAPALRGTAPNQFVYSQLSVSADQYFSWAFGMPDNYAGGNVRVTICWADDTSGGTGGNIRLRVNWSVIETGDLVDESGTSVDFTMTGVNTVSKAFRKATAQTFTPTGLAAGDMLRLNCGRLGSDGADTAASFTDLLGIFVEWDV